VVAILGGKKDDWVEIQMKRLLMVMMAAMVSSTGCTTLSLETYTFRQIQTARDVRDQLVLSSLAAVAANPESLPPYALYSNGITTVTDAVTLNQVSTWAPLKYTVQNLGLTASVQPKGQITADPTAEYQQLEALHASCLWALFGPERACTAHPGILGDPRQYLDGKPHFAVEARLKRTRPGWIQCGRLKDVPPEVRFKGHNGNTWVWVMPEDSESFAQFTLALQDIATLDPTVIASPPLLVQLTTHEFTKIKDLTSDTGNKIVTISTPEHPRAVKTEYREVIENDIGLGIKNGQVNLTRAQWFAYTDPWPGIRNSPGAASGNPTSAVTTFAPRTSPMQMLPPSPTPKYGPQKTVPEGQSTKPVSPGPTILVEPEPLKPNPK
jgi:hypothetical protein